MPVKQECAHTVSLYEMRVDHNGIFHKKERAFFGICGFAAKFPHMMVDIDPVPEKFRKELSCPEFRPCGDAVLSPKCAGSDTDHVQQSKAKAIGQ